MQGGPGRMSGACDGEPAGVPAVIRARQPGTRFVQAERNSPALTPATKEENAAAGTLSTGPLTTLESRTGTVPCAATRLVATSTQVPPLLLYEDLNQRGESVVTGSPFVTG